MSIVVRRTVVADAPALARIMGDAAVYPGLMQMPHTSEDVHRARLVETLQPGKQDLLLTAERDGEIAGSAGLHPVSPHVRRRHAMAFGISVAPEHQGHGVGSALLQAICDYADRWVGLLRLELQVYADNERAIRLYRRFGFAVEGRHPAYAMRDGAYVESLSMGRLHPNPPRPA